MSERLQSAGHCAVPDAAVLRDVGNNVPQFRSCKARRALMAVLVRSTLILLLPLMPIAPIAFSQALPAAEASPISTGFSLPSTLGTLQFGVSASESLSWGYYGNSGADSSTNLTGDLAYLSSSKNDPFSMVFSGGRGWSESSQPSYTFFNLGLSQVISAGRWNLLFSDSVSYLPSTPATGLSGIPGVGDLGVQPVQVGQEIGQGVLTNESTRVSNSALASISRRLTGKTSLVGSGSYAISRFVGDSAGAGLDSNEEAGSGALSHLIDSRTSLGGYYSYSSYNYPSYSGSASAFGAAQSGFSSQTAGLHFTRQLTRALGFSASAGPQWTGMGSNGSIATSLYASTSVSYTGEFSNASLAYTRSTNAGFGVTGGTLSDSVGFGASRTFDRVWNCALSSSYSQTSGLPTAGGAYSFHTTVAGFQVSRALARSLSTYASYTLENQSNQSAAATIDVYSGLTQVVGFGLSYSPTPIHLGRQ